MNKYFAIIVLSFLLTNVSIAQDLDYKSRADLTEMIKDFGNNPLQAREKYNTNNLLISGRVFQKHYDDNNYWNVILYSGVECLYAKISGIDAKKQKLNLNKITGGEIVELIVNFDSYKKPTLIERCQDENNVLFFKFIDFVNISEEPIPPYNKIDTILNIKQVRYIYSHQILDFDSYIDPRYSLKKKVIQIKDLIFEDITEIVNDYILVNFKLKGKYPQKISDTPGLEYRIDPEADKIITCSFSNTETNKLAKLIKGDLVTIICKKSIDEKHHGEYYDCVID